MFVFVGSNTFYQKLLTKIIDTERLKNNANVIDFAGWFPLILIYSSIWGCSVSKAEYS